MFIKKKENCREGGQRGYFLLTCDFASLQARLASIDTFLNECPDATFDSPEGQKAKPDPVLYSVYRDGSDTSDLHSMTGFGTFVGSIGMKAIRVHDDVDNKDYVFANSSKVRVERAGCPADGLVIKACELQPTDHILEHMKK